MARSERLESFVKLMFKNSISRGLHSGHGGDVLHHEYGPDPEDLLEERYRGLGDLPEEHGAKQPRTLPGHRIR